MTQTQTVLTAPTTTVASNGSVVITATVYPGVFVSGAAGVKFVDTTNNVRFGTVKPGRKCLLSQAPCPMSIKVRGDRLAKGVNTIMGTFSGDISETPSFGTIQITRESTNPTVTTTCQTGDSECVTNPDFSIDGTALASIATFAQVQQTETISVSFQTTELPCSTPATGDPLVFSSTNAPSEKYVSYSVLGAAADLANADYGTEGNVCLGSTQPFVTKGLVPPVLGPDGLYYGLLPDCDPNDVQPPCAEPASFETGEGEDEYSQTAIVLANDPRMSH